MRVEKNVTSSRDHISGPRRKIAQIGLARHWGQISEHSCPRGVNFQCIPDGIMFPTNLSCIDLIFMDGWLNLSASRTARKKKKRNQLHRDLGTVFGRPPNNTSAQRGTRMQNAIAANEMKQKNYTQSVTKDESASEDKGAERGRIRNRVHETQRGESFTRVQRHGFNTTLQERLKHRNSTDWNTNLAQSGCPQNAKRATRSQKNWEGRERHSANAVPLYPPDHQVALTCFHTYLFFHIWFSNTELCIPKEFWDPESPS
jgi:hypothetical protein